MAWKDDDFVPVTGGVGLADDYVRDDFDSLRNQDLTRLDDDTKQALLQDMNDLLGIKPLRTGKK